ncbi:MAG TPA: DUF2314 domain-containing protein [Verrucomicrobiae bacterium]
MNDTPEKPVYRVNTDAEMRQASQRAQNTFRFFWRELSWEYRRIIPALQMSAVKTMFADRPLDECGPADQVEQMWLKDVVFDGRVVTGKLLNQPNWLKSVRAGDLCSFPFEQLTDWMYAISGRVYGAFTANLMRSRMSVAGRREHDAAWGLQFGDPEKILLTTTGQTDENDETEHPMSRNMAPSLIKQLAINRGLINRADKQGWTFLHRESLAGNATLVKILLERGASRFLETNAGDKAIDFARLMRWQKIIALLSA